MSISSFNLNGSQNGRLSGNDKEKDLDITPNDLAVQHMQISFGK